MKRILVFIIFLSSLYIQAQTVAGKVYYHQILNLDSTAGPKNITGEAALLYFTDTVSYYVYNSEALVKFGAEPVNQEADTYDISTTDKIGEVFMTNFKRQKIYIREFIWKKPYLTIDTLKKINWILTGQEKTIGRFTCEKARSFFRGRYYEAWFAPEIPVPVGPWKLQGLPGLILEAYDEQQQVHYVFDGIDIPDPGIFSLKPPAKGQLVPVNTYRKLWQNETRKLKDFLQATAEKGTTIDVSVSYFPIERSYEP